MFHMPMSSPMMTTMLGFLSWATAVCATAKPMIALITSAIAKNLLLQPSIRISSLVRGSCRARLLDAERYQALVNQFSPVVDCIFSITPLEHGYVRDRCATD